MFYSLFIIAWEMSVFGIFFVRIFPHTGWIERDTLYPPVFSPIVGNYGPEKLQIRTLFTQCITYWLSNYDIQMSLSLIIFTRLSECKLCTFENSSTCTSNLFRTENTANCFRIQLLYNHIVVDTTFH